MSHLLEYIENKDIDLKETDYYAAIIGESPSKGAKSPSLWNHAFSGLGISGRMYPMDVKPQNLKNVIKNLRADRHFIGGAVTMPYKISIIPYIDKLEPEAEIIGAINCIYRDGDKLIGSNTDGAGALWSLKKEVDDNLSGKTAMLLGTGGAGFAVASYLTSALGGRGCLKLANRSNLAREKLANKLQDKCLIEQVNWPISPDDVKDLDILINCTSVGFETLKEDSKGVFSLKFYTPLAYVDDNIRINDIKEAEKLYFKKAIDAIKRNINKSIDILSAMKDPLIFDIIYQPAQSLLLFLANLIGYKTLNGMSMNLEQAVIAFTKAVSSAELCKVKSGDIRSLMQKIW